MIANVYTQHMAFKEGLREGAVEGRHVTHGLRLLEMEGCGHIKLERAEAWTSEYREQGREYNDAGLGQECSGHVICFVLFFPSAYVSLSLSS